MKCPRCSYEWESKVPQPKECPRCKGRMDYQPRMMLRAPSLEKREVRKAMASKLPWATATAFIIIAAIGTWAIFGGAPAAPPAGFATITATAGQGTVFAAGIPSGTASGIENVYIVDNSHGMGYNENFSGNENILGVITASAGSVNIPYETRFQIVVAVKVGSDNMAYVTKENMNVGLAAYGSFTIADENAQAPNKHANAQLASYSHDNSGYGTTSGWLRINAIWDNGGAGYVLPAGGTLNLENIRLWGWK